MTSDVQTLDQAGRCSAVLDPSFDIASLSDRQYGYLNTEVEYLREMVTEGIKRIRALERYTVIIAGSIWAWYASKDAGNQLSTEFQLLLWFPAMLTMLFGLRALGINLNILRARRFLRRLEFAHALPAALGWAGFIECRRFSIRVIASYLFWAVFQVATVVVPLCLTDLVITAPG